MLFRRGTSIQPPPLWVGGSSAPAIDIAAKHTDTYLSWGETPEQIEHKFDLVKERAKHYGRTLNCGIRLYVIVRDTDAEAWDHANWLYEKMDDVAIAGNQRFVSNTGFHRSTAHERNARRREAGQPSRS